MLKLRTLVFLLFCLLVVNSAYLAAYNTASLFYMSNVLVHVVAGIALLIGLAIVNRRLFLALAPAGAIGVYLMFVGTSRPHYPTLVVHIVLAWAAAAVAIAFWKSNRRAYVAVLAGAALLFGGAHLYRRIRPNHHDRIMNPMMAAETMDQEANGPNGKFFPSSANTPDGKIIPSPFFMESDSCQRCHADIYKQWQSSMHHFASFNNQFYRKSIEYMQETVGVQSSKWCAGCHDHALFFNGKFETPIAPRVHDKEAQAGLSCMSCHAIIHVDDTVGNGAMVIEYPPLHDMANSKNPVMRWLHDFLIKTAPGPHRRAFLKPFMREQSAEFCSACHKVHLDVPVNGYRWIRGFNEYDNWQASGVSGQGARSFYYPAKPQVCVDCHMPKVASKDFGNVDGMIHSHRFAAANTAVPYVNEDHEQLAAVQKFLTDKQVSVDIFAIAPGEGGSSKSAAAAGAQMVDNTPHAATTFAVGEEADTGTRGAAGPETPQGVGPIDAIHPLVHQGDDLRVDVVVRTRKVGHFFPGGTVDAFDVWVELKAWDENGKTIFWSGALENGNGPLEKGAHRYMSFLLDAHGNPIDKRNAYNARSTLYVRLIPPGAADTVRYRLKVPKDCGKKIYMEAKVNYRKFTWFYTNFAYAGVAQPMVEKTGGAPPYARGYDDRKMTFTGDLSGVSGKMKEIPNLPVTVMADAKAELDVVPAGAKVPAWKPSLRKEDRERWNDYGIGLLLQGDLTGAVNAFKNVTICEPGYADGWLNVARTYIQEGQTEEAKPWIDKALVLGPKLARVHFFRSQILKADGDYDGALAELQLTSAQYPRDRVVLNQIGRILFLKRDFKGAVDALQKVLLIDPEDVMAHYNLMLCYRGLGNAELASHEEICYRRFKADESSQAITGDYRLLNPEDNNERQPIHEHTGIPLGGAPAAHGNVMTTATRKPASRSRAGLTRPTPKGPAALPPVRSEASVGGSR